ncbi:MAG: InlB B-repeat-containing protein [Oscillospiraceae bacterium]
MKYEIPAYSKVYYDFYPEVSALSYSPRCSSYFGVELFQFDNYGGWNGITLNTDENMTLSSSHSLGRNIQHGGVLNTDAKLTAGTHFTKEFDNSHGKATTKSFYYGILYFYRSTNIDTHQMGGEWNFTTQTASYDKYIHYNANGGSGSANTEVVADYEKVTLHSGEGFTKENSAFVGWSDGDTTYAPGGEYSKTEGARLSAQYLTYDLNGGSGTVTPDVRGENGFVISGGDGITKENSAFLGWSDGSTIYLPGDVYTDTRGVVLNAQYLSYDLSGCSGSVEPIIRDEDGIVIADGSGIHKTGHTFKEWRTQPNGYGSRYAPGDTYSSREGVTLYPIFEPNKYDLTLIQDNCTVTVNPNPAVYGTQVTIVPEPAVGYQVDGYDVYQTDNPTVKVPLSANTFIQPEYPVTVKPVLSKIPYNIEKLPTDNGSFTVSHETAGIDDIVTVTAAPEEGFELGTITVSRADNGAFLTVTDGSFAMAPADVRVSVTFKSRHYDITKAPTVNGSFTLEPGSAIMDETVVVNAVPDEGYRVKSITAYKTGDETVTVEVTASSFKMPAFPVTVAVEFETAPLEIFKSTSIENGDIIISRTVAHPFEIVSLDAVGAEGYTLDAITVYKTQDPSVKVSVTDGSFVMPSYPVTVHATFKKIDYTVSVADEANEKGSFTVNKTTAQMGDPVTVDITCAEGWAVRGITITGSDGTPRLVGKTFTMPASNVTVSVSYMVIPTYVISIPARVELGGAPMTVAITNAVMEEGVSLKVHLETDFTARTAEGAVKSFTINGGAVQRGDVILTVEGGGTPEAPKSGSAQLALEWDEIYQYSGSYRASLSFTIKVEDAGYDQTE